MWSVVYKSDKLMCRAPHGARGLKCIGRKGLLWVGMSRPAWGAWIEIQQRMHDEGGTKSRPAWGAWIEMLWAESTYAGAASRPAWGAWIEIPCRHLQPPLVCVAPRMGRVD